MEGDSPIIEVRLPAHDLGPPATGPEKAADRDSSFAAESAVPTVVSSTAATLVPAASTGWSIPIGPNPASVAVRASGKRVTLDIAAVQKHMRRNGNKAPEDGRDV